MRLPQIPLYPNNYTPSKELKLPQAHKLSDQRALVMRSKKDIGSAPSWIRIDDCGSCKENHAPNHAPLFHLVYGSDNRQWALRCPNSIPNQDQWRVIVDFPEGSIHQRFAEFIRTHGRYRDAANDASNPGFSRFDE